jgi:hypothetical protein
LRLTGNERLTGNVKLTVRSTEKLRMMENEMEKRKQTGNVKLMDLLPHPLPHNEWGTLKQY